MLFFYLLLLLVFGLLLHAIVNRINDSSEEGFTTNYIPIKDRNITQDKPPNLNNLITDPIKDYKTTLQNWRDYKRIQTAIMESNEIEGSSASVNARVAADLRWRIHRWSIWDFLPSLKYPYYCLVNNFNGDQVCQPITNDINCRVGKVYKNPVECLKNIQKKNENVLGNML